MEDLNGIRNIVFEDNPDTQVFEFDIDTLPVRKARELEAYVNEKISQQAKK